MEKKIANMTAAEIAAMRQAQKEAEAAYFNAKVDALESMVGEMQETERDYFLKDLAAKSGLTTKEITQQFIWERHCRAAVAAGINNTNNVRIRKFYRVVSRKYVEVSPNGEINPNSTLIVNNREVMYTVSDR